MLLWWSAAAVVVANALHGAALLTIHRGRRQDAARSGAAQDVHAAAPEALTLVRPMRGLEPDAVATHETLFSGRCVPEEVLFVVESADDTAVEGVRPILERHPGRARLLVSQDAPPVPSAKVRNMIVGWKAANTPLVGFCDSDIRLGPQHLAACVREFADPQVGGVSVPIIYVSEGAVGRLKMLIETCDNAAFTNAAAYTQFGTVTLGGLMIFRKAHFDAAGGVEPLGDALADDLRAGERLHRAGYKIRLANAPLLHNSGPEPVRWSLARYHRWLTSIRTEIPVFFWLQFTLLNPMTATLFGALALSLMGSAWAPAAWGLFAVNALVRTATAMVAERLLLRPYGIRLGAWVLARLPADLLLLATQIASLVFPYVYWRGRWFRVRWGSGRILREITKPTTPCSPRGT